MEPLAISTETRVETGKGAMRRLRAKGLTPAVFYGPNSPKAVQIAVSPKALLHALATPYKRNQVMALDVGGERKLAMVRELQVHPLTRQVQHVDFYEVALDRTIDVRVPFTTEGRAKGVIAGGEITVVFRDVPLRATPNRVPPVINVDVTNMELGHVFRVKDLALPEGVSALLDPERSLVTCAEPRKRLAEEDEAAAATPGAVAAAPTGTTTPPPAGGKAPAAKPAAKGKK
ncbi:MAG TPA: 50S ribosomal protein L25 [Polyangiales bacterium]|nr:50S ribosomal protein L25 [Polyangiales bacterium]